MIDAPHDTILDEVTRTIVERFAPERIVLFGSRGRGDHRPDSDYDLMIVLEQPPEPPDIVARTVLAVFHNADVLVDSRDRFERRRTDIGTLEYVVDREGLVLYARAPVPRPPRIREPGPSRPESLAECVARAESDFTAMELLHGSPSAPGDAVVFHAHKGIEKMLKAALVARRVPPPRTHLLLELFQKSPDDLRDNPVLRESCVALSALWPSTRYPLEPLPTNERVEQAVARARVARAILSAAVD